MPSALWRFSRLFGLSLCLVTVARGVPQSGGDFSSNPDAKKLPTETILVKGTWSSASDSVTPVPEGGRLANNSYSNSYFGLTYTLAPGWIEKYSGPPPSDSGYYVLAQIRPADTSKETSRGSILIAAQDMFFTLTPAANALDLINFTKDHMIGDNTVEQPPAPVTIAGHSFIRFDYGSPIAELHWHVLATQIRCHTVEFVLTSHDTELMESLIQEMNTMILPAEAGAISGTGGGEAPVCIKDYASEENVIAREDPVFRERRFNSIPVRIVIDKEGRVKHIHVLNAFPEQAKAISDALVQWRFRPYLQSGKPVEVETGILFGRAPRRTTQSATGTVSE
jgi:hypothetical protein